MDSVSLTHSHISRKLSLLCELGNLGKYNTEDLEQIQTEYKLGSLLLIVSYHEELIDKKPIVEDYEAFLIAENIIENINRLAINILNLPLPPIAGPLIHEYNQLQVRPKTVECKVSTCEICNIPLIVRPAASDQCCPLCGIIIPLKGTYFDLSSDTCAKNGPYKPSKHCEQWVTRIFAQETTAIPDLLIQDIIKCMTRDGVKTNQLTCPLIRDSYLKKELRQTKYNANVPKIRRIITGISPPQPTNAEYTLICQMFDLIDELFITVRPDGFSSRRYYPHFIRKIIEIVYHTRPKIKNAIIGGIHMQEKKTTDSHDMLWEKICKASDGRFAFSKTKEIIYYHR